VLAVLFLRGAQTPGELKQRTERLQPFADLAALQAVLDRLVARELVARLPRRPGQKEERYAHRLGEAADDGDLVPAPPAPATATAAAAPVPRSPGFDGAAPSAPAPGGGEPLGVAAAPRDDARLDALEREVAGLRADLAELREQLSALRAELGA
jgi:uncharacterized protein